MSWRRHSARLISTVINRLCMMNSEIGGEFVLQMRRLELLYRRLGALQTSVHCDGIVQL